MMHRKTEKGQLNIAMLGHKRVPSRDGGVEVVVTELSVRMAARGHQVTCYNRTGQYLGEDLYGDARLKEYQGVHLKYMPTIDHRGISAFTSSVTGAVCCTLRHYDVVHFHAEGPSAMCWLPKLFGKRVIVTVHGLDHQRAKWGWFARRFIMAGEKGAVDFADEIIVLSRQTQRYFLEKYNRKTCFIPNGVTRPKIRPAKLIREQFGLEKDSYILFLGRIVPEKGLRYLIEAFRRTDTDKKLVIAGGSSDTDAFCDELLKLSDADERVLFTGFVQSEILEELYSNAWFYVLPSDLEGMPLSLLEAMSYGNCCLVSSIAECTEVVENKAVIFEKGNTEDLREKMQMLCDRPDLVASFRAGAADFICGKYNWDEVVSQTLELYHKQKGS